MPCRKTFMAPAAPPGKPRCMVSEGDDIISGPDRWQGSGVSPAAGGKKIWAFFSPSKQLYVCVYTYTYICIYQDTKMVKRTPLVFLLKANTYVWGMALTTSRKGVRGTAYIHIYTYAYGHTTYIHIYTYADGHTI